MIYCIHKQLFQMHTVHIAHDFLFSGELLQRSRQLYNLVTVRPTYTCPKIASLLIIHIKW